MSQKRPLFRRRLKRTLRMHRRSILTLLLLCAASPSLIAVYLFEHPKEASVEPNELSTRALSKTSSTARQQLSFHCDGTTTPCCIRWDENVNTDTWWLNHPTYETRDNTTHTCFEKVADAGHADFLQRVFDRQWSSSSSSCLQRTQISSGYAAALTAVARSFYATFQQDGNNNINNKFQLSRGHVNAHWNFSPFDTSHWAYCETSDLNCYFLPLSDCVPTLGQNDAPRGGKPSTGKAANEFFWLRQFAFRQKHLLRQKLQEYMQQHALPMELSSCTAIHVRRGDIAFGRGRRYAAVHEYLEAGKVEVGSTVVLLTDDVSTIEEVGKYHENDYNWIILDRPRFRGSEGGFEAFVPSRDPSLEVLAILAEMRLAGMCQKLVHGKSGFVALISDAMKASGRPSETVYLQTQLEKKEQPKMDPKDRAAVYLNKIQNTLSTAKDI